MATVTKSAAQVVREMREAGATAQNAQLESGSEPKQCNHVLVDVEPKCMAINASNGARCGRVLLGKAGRPWEIRCPRCGTLNNSESRG